MTSAVKNLMDQLLIVGQDVEWPDWPMPWPRADIIHLHYTNPAKVSLAIGLARLSGRKLVWTVHNSRLDAARFPSHARAIAQVDGVVFLNEEVCIRNSPLLRAQTKWKVLTPIVRSGALHGHAIEATHGVVRLLLYASQRTFEAGETYGLEWTFKYLDRMPKNWVFTVVDPSGQYAGRLPQSTRVNYIPRPVASFTRVLAEHDIYLRPTTTDGQSVAVLESLCVGTPVVASDAVPRPPGVVLYRHLDPDDYIRAIHTAASIGKGRATVHLSSAEDYLEFYGECLKSS